MRLGGGRQTVGHPVQLVRRGHGDGEAGLVARPVVAREHGVSAVRLAGHREAVGRHHPARVRQRGPRVGAVLDLDPQHGPGPDRSLRDHGQLLVVRPEAGRALVDPDGVHVQAERVQLQARQRDAGAGGHRHGGVDRPGRGAVGEREVVGLGVVVGGAERGEDRVPGGRRARARAVRGRRGQTERYRRERERGGEDGTVPGQGDHLSRVGRPRAGPGGPGSGERPSGHGP